MSEHVNAVSSQTLLDLMLDYVLSASLLFFLDHLEADFKSNDLAKVSFLKVLLVVSTGIALLGFLDEIFEIDLVLLLNLLLENLLKHLYEHATISSPLT